MYPSTKMDIGFHKLNQNLIENRKTMSRAELNIILQKINAKIQQLERARRNSRQYDSSSNSQIVLQIVLRLLPKSFNNKDVEHLENFIKKLRFSNILYIGSS